MGDKQEEMNTPIRQNPTSHTHHSQAAGKQRMRKGKA